jgi:formylglycine-generating enzyme required for sulfatase activity
VHGNQWEWCLDGFRWSAYDESASVDPVVPWGDGAAHAIRGGCFHDIAVRARSAHRHNGMAGARGSMLGLRPARAVAQG